MNKQNLLDHLTQQMNDSRKSIACIAGHFALITLENGETVPAIHQDVTDEKAIARMKREMYMAELPLETFDMGLRLSQQARVPFGITLLVNDHQYINKNDPGSNEANPFRESFYENFLLPESYSAKLDAFGNCDGVFLLNTDDKLTYHKNRWYFSESKLRNRYHGRKEYQACNLSGECARELAPYFDHVSKYAQMLIILAPGTCMNPINEATRYVVNNPELDLEIHSVFIFESHDLDRFWKTAIYCVNGEREIIE